MDIDIRSYMLHHGPVEPATAPGAAAGPVAVPDLWWPEDRTWFPGADPGWFDICLGGQPELITALVDEVRASR